MTKSTNSECPSRSCSLTIPLLIFPRYIPHRYHELGSALCVVVIDALKFDLQDRSFTLDFSWQQRWETNSLELEFWNWLLSCPLQAVNNKTTSSRINNSPQALHPSLSHQMGSKLCMVWTCLHHGHRSSFSAAPRAPPARLAAACCTLSFLH